MIGPSLGPRAVKPWARKLPIPSAPSQSRARITQKREPLIVNLNPSGAVLAHFSQLFADWRE